MNNLSKEIEITIQNIEIANLDNRLENLVIAQISDLHIHHWNIDLIEHMVEVLNRLNPDIVTMTGDAICNGKKYIPDLVKLFSNINSKYGKFSCLGNHDHSDGDNGRRIQDAYKKSDFQILVNQSFKAVIDGKELFIAGADDLELGEQNIIKTAKSVPPEATSIFLIHNPHNFDEFANFNPDLVLAGHTHGGQLYFPILDILYRKIMKSKYISGLFRKNDSTLYVNRGIGTALVSPVIFNKKFIINTPRINSKPEISLFRLKSKAA